MTQEIALIVGAGPGLSASLARLCTQRGFLVALAARNIAKLEPLAAETKARLYACDVADRAAVAALFAALDRDVGSPDLVVFNASERARGPLVELDPERVQRALMVGCFGGFLVGREAAQRMRRRGSGSILFTGATASVKGFAGSAGFAMPKFGLRGLAQSMARELAPENIHVAHIVIDGGIANPAAGRDPVGGEEPPDRWLDPDAIAETYLHLHRQHRSAWTWEIEVRPWVERF